jgi:glycine/D-amino acid oxidase-like deaminating enzyme
LLERQERSAHHDGSLTPVILRIVKQARPDTSARLEERSYWQTTVTMPEVAAAALPARVDVAVIGGGITGLCAARSLARRGISVAVLEAHTIGWGASSRNGGMVLPGLKVGVETLIARYGLELARRLFQASVDSVDVVEKIVADERIDCHFKRGGHLALASKRTHYEHFVRGAELLAREFSNPVRLVERADLRTEIGSDAYFGGMVDEVSGGINPAQYVAGLDRAARNAGATLHEKACVERITRAGSRWQLHTTLGALDAGEILVATSGYSGEVTQALNRRLLPIGSYVIATEPLTEALAHEISPRRRMMYDSWHFLHYFRLTPDRRLLFGGRARFVPETQATIRESAAVLQQGMLSVFPQLRSTRVDYAWGGTLDFAYDTMPHLGQIDGYHYALGYAGHGVALASLLGTYAGETLGTAALQASPFAQLPFPGAPLGLHRGKTWFLKLAAAWYRFLDRVA